VTARVRKTLDVLRARHDVEWRDPAAIAGQWREAGDVDGRLLRHVVRGKWWETLAELGVTLLVSREYEHLLIAMRAGQRGPVVTYMRLPHPSGLVADVPRGVVHVASTRNPNQIYDFRPAIGLASGSNGCIQGLPERPLVPVRARFFPGALYLHDLALVGGTLHANAVGQNAVVRLDDTGAYERVWWPRSIETGAGPVFTRNHLQLNSIAAGADLERSFFSASTDRMSARRPGHRNFPVDRRGVVFSGATREPVVSGLTRPHSARLWADRLWVDNSGYGEVGVVDQGSFSGVARLPGWTRGLCFRQRVAFVGTSRVLPRFRQYAPGLDLTASVCGVHVLSIESGKVVGSLMWPYGNQTFALECVPTGFTSGFPFRAGAKRTTRLEKELFYAFVLGDAHP